MQEGTNTSEVGTNKSEEQIITDVLIRLTEEERINIVAQSFIVGAGSIQAHDMYVYYLCKMFALQPKEGGLLLRECFSSLSEDGKRKVIQAAYQKHLDIMKKDVKSTKKTSARLSEPIGNFEAAVKAIETNLPNILGNKAFQDITAQEENLIAQLPQEFSPTSNSLVVQTLRKISADRGYYDDREWYKRTKT